MLPSSRPFTNFSFCSRARTDARRGVVARASALALMVVAALVAIASPVSATPVDLYFNGPLDPFASPSHASTRWGISLASAQNANTAFGVQIVEPTVFGQIAGKLSVLQPGPLTVGSQPASPSVLDPVRASEPWQIQNISGSSFQGAVYLLFTHTDPFSVGSTLIDYPQTNVGIRIDKDLGWSIAHIRSSGNDYYYPALRLDFSTLNAVIASSTTGGPSVTANINYVVSQALIQAGGDGHLPEFQLGFAQVVPEPGTALLLGLGLAGLALGRKRA